MNSIEFKEDMLRFVVQEKTLDLHSMIPLFKDLKNCFKDALPDIEYFDMAETLNQYKMIYPEFCEGYLESWKVKFYFNLILITF